MQHAFKPVEQPLVGRYRQLREDHEIEAAGAVFLNQIAERCGAAEEICGDDADRRFCRIGGWGKASVVEDAHAHESDHRQANSQCRHVPVPKEDEPCSKQQSGKNVLGLKMSQQIDGPADCRQKRGENGDGEGRKQTDESSVEHALCRSQGQNCRWPVNTAEQKRCRPVSRAGTFGKQGARPPFQLPGRSLSA